MEHSQETDYHQQRLSALIKSLQLDQSDLVLLLLFVLITGLYAILMFTDRVPIWGFAVLFSGWALYLVITHRTTYGTPMDVPILGLLALLPVTLWISIDKELTLINISSLILCAALFYMIVRWARTTERLPIIVFLLIFLALAISILGLLGTDWKRERFQAFNLVYDLLPNWVAAMPGNLLGVGINANSLGGVLVFFPPLFLSLLLDKGGFGRMFIKEQSRSQGTLKWLYKGLLVVSMLFVSGIVILTQSRGSILGLLLGIITVLACKDQRLLWLAPILFLGGIFVWQFLGTNWLTLIDIGQESTLGARLTLWRDSVYILQDFPFTGVGLNTFNPIRNEFYRYVIFEGKDSLFFHAHNTFLTVAVEMGLPSVSLYAAMLGSFGWMAWRVIKTGRSFTRSLAVGLVGGLLAHQLFGLMDAYTLGKKLGAVMWIVFGVMTALFIHRHELVSSVGKKVRPVPGKLLKKRRKHLLKKRFLLQLIAIGLWLLLSLASVGLVNINPYLSLMTAILGGILLGIDITYRYWLSDHVRHP